MERGVGVAAILNLARITICQPNRTEGFLPSDEVRENVEFDNGNVSQSRTMRETLGLGPIPRKL